jgi:hypothetical protein
MKVYTKLVAYFATSKNLCGKTHNKIDHILTDRQRHLSVLDVRSIRAADCDKDHYLVVATVTERPAVNKKRSHRFNVERFNLK